MFVVRRLGASAGRGSATLPRAVLTYSSFSPLSLLSAAVSIAATATTVAAGVASVVVVVVIAAAAAAAALISLSRLSPAYLAFLLSYPLRMSFATTEHLFEPRARDLLSLCP